MPSTSAIRELRRRGMLDRYEKRILKAKFYVSTGTEQSRVITVAEKQRRKFVDKMTVSGWELMDEPVVSRITLVDEHNMPEGIQFKDGLWHPNMLWEHKIIPRDHEFVHHGDDLYMIWAPFRRPAVIISHEIDDDMLRKWQDENDPVLKGLVIA